MGAPIVRPLTRADVLSTTEVAELLGDSAFDRLRARSARRPAGAPRWASLGALSVDEDLVFGRGFPLGPWVREMRRRRAAGELRSEQTAQIDEFPGWRWNARQGRVADPSLTIQGTPLHRSRGSGRAYDGRVPVMEAPLVERERELDTLARMLEATRRGFGGAVLVEGPPGIGKSRLLAAAAVSAEDLLVRRARASELERDFPFGVVRQLFEPVLFASSGTERERLLAGAAGLAERVLAVTAADHASDAFATLHGLYWFAVNLSASRPVVLLVDDVQWCDADSLRWLVFLLRRLEGVPLALVVGMRAGEADATEALLDELVGDPGLRTIRPAVLSDAGVARLVERSLGAAPESDFVNACRLATGGNPFLLGELLGVLAERAVDPTAASASVIDRLSVSGVGRALRSRLRRLPPGSVEFARAVSVLGDGCSLTVAARLANLGERVAARAADALAAASVLEPSRPLTFIHPLVRASVYGDLGAGGRSTWHRRAARVLTEAQADVDRIAVHLLACEPGGETENVKLLRAAAESARGREAHDVAATYLRRALHEPPSPDLEPELVFELGSAELGAGQIEAAVEQLTRALGLATDPSRRALVALELARAQLFTHRGPEAVHVLSDAIHGLAEADPEQTARLAALRAAAALTSLGALRSAPALPEPRRTPRKRPRTIGERLVLGPQAMRALLTGTAEDARGLALCALGDGELLAATGAHDPTFYASIAPLIWSHAFEDAERQSEAALDDARRRGSEAGFATASHFRTALWWQRGMLAELEADARAALASGIIMIAFPLASVIIAESLVERGDPEAAEAELQAAGLDAGTPEQVAGCLVPLARAHISLARHEPDEALELLRECGRFEKAWGVTTPSLTNWRAEAAVLLAHRGDHEEARRLAVEAARRAEAFGSPVARGIALRAGALVARPPDHERLAESATLLRASGARLELARTLVELGAGLRRAGRRPAAREPLREGLELAMGCGARALARRAHEELVAAGARPRRDPAESRGALTASELRVARKAADGMTNREIAQALFLTEKTIEVHLTRAYRKLDIQSRSQLATALTATAVA
jgi:DNA-binding CsgD family transcriptional regulator/predicted negative regulator of RcsB-dependent stress response